MMPRQLLVNIMRVPAIGTLAPGAIVTLPHGLKSNDQGVLPNQYLPWSATNIIVNFATTSDVTFQNTGDTAQFAFFRVEYDHTIHAVGTGPLYWRGINGTTPPSGPAGGDLAGTYPNPTVDGFATKPIDTSAPAANDYWQYDGTTWRHVAVSPGTPAAVWAQFSDSVSQNLSGTAIDLQLDTKDGGVAGITIATDPVTLRPSRITVSSAGVYAFTISPQLEHFGGGGAELVRFYAVTNTGTVPNSASYTELGNNNRATLPYLELILPMSAGGWLQWWMASAPGTNIRVQAIAAAPPVPAAPSVIAGVKLIGV